MTFTLPMMIARLTVGALATLAMGLATSVVSRRSLIATLTAAALLLLVFIPEHIRLWDKFPVWYHLTFLLSLVPLAYLGGMTSRRRDHGKQDSAGTRAARMGPVAPAR
jgi:NhaP-type Na+/H+ or K+/H+ antiporter